MTPDQRREIEEALEESSARATRLLETHSPDALTRRPTESSWSAAECVVHLTLTTEASLPLLEDALADLRSRGARREGPSRMDGLGRLLRWSLEPPSRLKTKTKRPFQPLSVEPLARVLPEFLEGQRRIVERLRSAEGLDLTRVRVRSPFDPRIRYNPYSMFRILETHERRHLWQAENALKGLGR